MSPFGRRGLRQTPAPRANEKLMPLAALQQRRARNVAKSEKAERASRTLEIGFACLIWLVVAVSVAWALGLMPIGWAT